MFENETAEEMLLKAIEGRYKTRKGWLEERIALRVVMGQTEWVAGVDAEKNAAILAGYREQMAYLEAEYIKACDILNPALEEARQKVLWAAQPIFYLYEPGYTPKG